MGIGQTRSILENPDRPWKVTSPVKEKSIWNSYSPGLVTYKGVDPYPRQVVGRGPWMYGRTIVQLYGRRISGIGTWVPEVPENVSNRCTGANLEPNADVSWMRSNLRVRLTVVA